MASPLAVEAATAWRDYAQCDVEVALAGWDRPTVSGWAIALHCQQAVEKSLKGALVLHEVAPPKIHVLTALAKMVANVGLVPPLSPELFDALTPFAVDDKYPRLRLLPIQRDEAQAFITHAQAAVWWLTASINDETIESR